MQLKPNIQQKQFYFSKQLLKKSVQIGHKSLSISKSRSWHPLMTHYLLGIRNNISIINSAQTLKQLLNAYYIIILILKNKGRLLVVNTNPEYFRIFKNISSIQKNSVNKKNADIFSILNSSLISYCNNQWIGGTLTNWKQISRSALTFAKFSERFDNFLTKNNIYFPQYKKMKKRFQGLVIKVDEKIILAFKKTPDLILIVNPNENRNVIDEANCLNIPVLAFTDSNTDLLGITYPIPVNCNSIHFLYLFLNWLFKITSK